jgi:phage-related minor tail protein
MALAETARLAVELALTDKLTPGLKTADASLAGLTKSTAVQTKALTGLGDKQTRFAKLAGAAGTAFKAMGGVASAGFALATQGAIELEDAQVDIQRETGLTADAARDAAKAINGIAGRNVSDIKTVSAAFEKVHNDLGLTGQAALDVTEQFVEFGRATKQGPAEAVSAFDDILDSFGITADHSGEIMDKLVASHQKYGGAIDANEAALAGMAPQLKALNLNIDDGIGLLNLFASSGLDAAGAQKALNTAITKLPAGHLAQRLHRPPLDDHRRRPARTRGDAGLRHQGGRRPGERDQARHQLARLVQGQHAGGGRGDEEGV